MVFDREILKVEKKNKKNTATSRRKPLAVVRRRDMTSPLFYFLLPFFFPHILSLDLCFVKRRGFIFEMNVHGCGLIPLSYELALFITELGSGGDESIN